MLIDPNITLLYELTTENLSMG